MTIYSIAEVLFISNMHFIHCSYINSWFLVSGLFDLSLVISVSLVFCVTVNNRLLSCFPFPSKFSSQQILVFDYILFASLIPLAGLLKIVVTVNFERQFDNLLKLF